jgi:hypothetical protein
LDAREQAGSGGRLNAPRDDAPRDFATVLHACGLRLACVNSEDVRDREKMRAAFRQYVTLEAAEKFGLKEPPPLAEGQLVLVAIENNQPAHYPFAVADLPSVRNAEREVKAAFYLRLGDLARRWHYTKQGVQKLARKDFPRPCFTMNEGKVRIWALVDIEKYERDRRELHSEAAKLLKVRGFARARQRSAAPSGA